MSLIEQRVYQNLNSASIQPKRSGSNPSINNQFQTYDNHEIHSQKSRVQNPGPFIEGDLASVGTNQRGDKRLTADAFFEKDLEYQAFENSGHGVFNINETWSVTKQVSENSQSV